MHLAKDQGSFSWPFLLLRRILAGGNKRNMSRSQRFMASLNKGRCLKAQPVSPEQGWRYTSGASYPVQSCLWHRIMALCNLAQGQEGVCMLVVVHSWKGQPGSRRRGSDEREKQLWVVTLGSATTFCFHLNGWGQMSKPGKANRRPEQRQVPWASVPQAEGKLSGGHCGWVSVCRGLSTYRSCYTVSYIPHPASPWSREVRVTL